MYANQLGLLQDNILLYSGSFSFDRICLSSAECFCLEIVSVSIPPLSSGIESGRWYSARCLVVEPVIDNPDMYRRIGVAIS